MAAKFKDKDRVQISNTRSKFVARLGTVDGAPKTGPSGATVYKVDIDGGPQNQDFAEPSLRAAPVAKFKIDDEVVVGPNGGQYHGQPAKVIKVSPPKSLTASFVYRVDLDTGPEHDYAEANLLAAPVGVKTSPEGATWPELDPIVLDDLSAWTVKDGVVYVTPHNGGQKKAGYSAGVVGLKRRGGHLHQHTSAGWWMWTGGPETGDWGPQEGDPDDPDPTPDPTPTPDPEPTPDPDPTPAPVGAKRLGTMLSSDQCTDQIAAWMKREGISSVTCRWEMKPAPWLGDRKPADKVADFCRKHGFSLRIHCVAWHISADPFMEVTDKATKRKQLTDFAKALVTAYGDIPDVCIDVANECFTDGGGVRDTPLVRSYGGVTTAALYEMVNDIVAAVKAIKNIPCFYNEYGYAEWPDAGKQNACVALVKNTNVDGLGDQYHPANPGGQPDVPTLKAAVKRITDLGKRFQFTEIGIPQALLANYKALFEGGAAAERDTFWGGFDGNADVSGGPGSPTQPWNTNLTPKPDIVALAHAFAGSAPTPIPVDPNPTPATPVLAKTADGKSVKVQSTYPAGTRVEFARSAGDEPVEATGYLTVDVSASYPGTPAQPWVGARILPSDTWSKRLKTTQAAPDPIPVPDPDPGPAGKMIVGVDIARWGADQIPHILANGIRYVRVDTDASIAALKAAGIEPIYVYGTGGSLGGLANDAAGFAAHVKSVVVANNLKYVEILNEPGAGSSWFWSDPGNIPAIVAVLKATFEALKGTGCKVLASWCGGNHASTHGRALKAAGGLAYCDIVTTHPYGGSGSQFGGNDGQRSMCLEAKNESGKPVMITELGWPTMAGTGDSPLTSEAQQAVNITNFCNWGRANGMAGFIYFNYAGDDPGYAVNHQRPSVSPKPGWDALGAQAEV